MPEQAEYLCSRESQTPRGSLDQGAKRITITKDI